MEILSDSIFGLILHHICSSGNWGCWYFPELKVTQVKVDWRPLNYVLGSCRYRTSLGGLRQCSVASKYNLFPLVFAWQWEKSDWCLSVRPVYFVVGSSGFRTSHRGRNGWFQSPTRSLLSRHPTKLDPFHDLRPLQQPPEYGKFPRYASDRMATEATLRWNRSTLLSVILYPLQICKDVHWIGRRWYCSSQRAWLLDLWLARIRIVQDVRGST